MPRTHGYSDQGKRCYGTHDWGAKGRTNAIGALIGSTLIAIGLITGSVNTKVFTSWVEQILLPSLPKESVIVMDNAAFHKGKDMQKNSRRFRSHFTVPPSIFSRPQPYREKMGPCKTYKTIYKLFHRSNF